jgi:hypothetical protein
VQGRSSSRLDCIDLLVCTKLVRRRAKEPDMEGLTGIPEARQTRHALSLSCSSLKSTSLVLRSTFVARFAKSVFSKHFGMVISRISSYVPFNREGLIGGDVRWDLLIGVEAFLAFVKPGHRKPSLTHL